jgi:hypothetical protein
VGTVENTPYADLRSDQLLAAAGAPPELSLMCPVSWQIVAGPGKVARRLVVRGGDRAAQYQE